MVGFSFFLADSPCLYLLFIQSYVVDVCNVVEIFSTILPSQMDNGLYIYICAAQFYVRFLFCQWH